MPSIIRRIRTRLPTCLSIGLGSFFAISAFPYCGEPMTLDSRRFTPGAVLLLRTDSLDLEVSGVFLASIRGDLILDLLTLIESAEAGAFNGRDVNENVLPTPARRLNKPIAFHRIEPLHSTACHRRSPC